MAEPTNTQNIIDNVLRRAGELIDPTGDFAAPALEYINKVHRAIISGSNEYGIDINEDWSWARSKFPEVITLKPKFDTGTVSLTKGSTAGTFSSAPAESMQDRYLKIDERPEFFRIASHTAAAAPFTLDFEYTDTTGAALSFKAIKLNYDLTPGGGIKIIRLISPFTIYKNQDLTTDREGKVFGISLNELKSKYPLIDIVEGVPTVFTQIAEADGIYTVRFNKFVETETRLEYEFIPEPTTLTDSPSNVPLIPIDFRDVLEYGAIYHLLVDKNDQKSNEFKDLLVAKIRALIKDHRRERSYTAKRKGKLVPRQEEIQNLNRTILTRFD